MFFHAANRPEVSCPLHLPHSFSAPIVQHYRINKNTGEKEILGETKEYSDLKKELKIEKKIKVNVPKIELDNNIDRA